MGQDTPIIPNIRFDLRDRPLELPRVTTQQVPNPNDQHRLGPVEENCIDRTQRSLRLDNRLVGAEDAREVSRLISRICPNPSAQNLDMLPEDDMSLRVTGTGMLRFRVQTNGPRQ